MNQEILQLYKRRIENVRKWIEFGMRPEPKSGESPANSDFLDVVRLKNYFGLSHGQHIRLLPAFDEVILSANGMLAYCRIANLWTMYDTNSCEEVLAQSLPERPIYHEDQNTLELVTTEKRHGLYDLIGRRMLLKPEFDDVDCCAAYSHLWVRKDSRWGYVNKETQRVTLVPDMSMAYEANGGMFLRYNDKIICIDENGSADTEALRRFVLKGRGRGEIRNAKYHETVVFNIYGDILY